MINIITPIAYAHTEADDFGHHMFSDGMWGVGGFTGMIIFWFIVVAVFIFISQLIFKSTTRDKEHGPREDALDILKERYAKGEIDRKQYESIKKDIK